MTSSLGYKRNAKRTETNVIGDGFPLTNFCSERWCQQINMPRIFWFRCIFLGQCTLKLITLSHCASILSQVPFQLFVLFPVPNDGSQLLSPIF